MQLNIMNHLLEDLNNNTHLAMLSKVVEWFNITHGNMETYCKESYSEFPHILHNSTEDDLKDLHDLHSNLKAVRGSLWSMWKESD